MSVSTTPPIPSPKRKGAFPSLHSESKNWEVIQSAERLAAPEPLRYLYPEPELNSICPAAAEQIRIARLIAINLRRISSQQSRASGYSASAARSPGKIKSSSFSFIRPAAEDVAVCCAECESGITNDQRRAAQNSARSG